MIFSYWTRCIQRTDCFFEPDTQRQSEYNIFLFSFGIWNARDNWGLKNINLSFENKSLIA